MCNTKRAIQKLLNIVLLLFVPLLPAPDAFGQPERSPKGKPGAKADFVLTVKDNRISLDAKDASLKEVLEEIGRKMSIEVLALLPEQERITTELENLSLEDAIERLIRNYPHLVVLQEGDRKIRRIVALQKSGDIEPSKPVMQGPEIKKEQNSAKPATKQEAIRNESPPPEQFKFQFDPSPYGKKRR
jgi:hypothetical protein